MAPHLRNELCCPKHCWCTYEQNSIVNSVRADDWTTALVVIASNEYIFIQVNSFSLGLKLSDK